MSLCNFRESIRNWCQCIILTIDLANGSGQSGSDSTHTGLGHKMGRPKWVVQPMTHTRSFKGRVKTGLIRIFTHEKIYIKNENKLDPIV